jgi:hypothetical protein
LRVKFEKGSFMGCEPGLCDLVWAIDLTLIALAEPEADARIVQVALENGQRKAADLNKKWYADCERLIEKIELALPVSRKVKARWDAPGILVRCPTSRLHRVKHAARPQGYRNLAARRPWRADAQKVLLARRSDAWRNVLDDLIGREPHPSRSLPTAATPAAAAFAQGHGI